MIVKPIANAATTLALTFLPIPASAAEYLTEVISEVYQTSGTSKEIAQRGATCISQSLSAGTTEAQIIISSDLDGGTVVARNAIDQGGLMRWQLRSRFTFEARDGRFRIEQTGLERFNQGRWGPIGKWAGSQWKGAETAFTASADTVARCVLTPSQRNDW